MTETNLDPPISHNNTNQTRRPNHFKTRFLSPSGTVQRQSTKGTEDYPHIYTYVRPARGGLVARQIRPYRALGRRRSPRRNR